MSYLIIETYATCGMTRCRNDTEPVIPDVDDLPGGKIGDWCRDHIEIHNTGQDVWLITVSYPS